uniref:Uncharacterized protein n=1 Tax=Colletotrichum fructicola (strain Nara gc5) TaxID=1213859 RepID=L2FGV9_COLFN
MHGAERTFENVIRPIFQLIRFFLTEHESYVHIFRSMPVDVFPGIMSAYCRLFELAISEMERRYVAGGERGLDLAHSEGVAVLDPARRVYLHRTRAPPTEDGAPAAGHPRQPPGWGVALHRPSPAGPLPSWGGECGYRYEPPRHHYGDRIVSHRETEIWFSQLGRDAFRSHAAVVSCGVGCRGDAGGIPTTSGQKEACKVAITAWEAAPDAFTSKALQRLTEGLTPGGPRVVMAPSRMRPRHDFTAELVRVVVTEKGRAAFAPAHATWPDHLQAALTSSGGLKPNEWASVLARGLLVAGVEWAPDAVRGRLTSTNIVSLRGREGTYAVATGPPGSLRRAAQEAEIKHEKALNDRALRQTRRAINFSDSFPFTNVPSLITNGFLQAKAIFSGKGDARVLDNNLCGHNDIIHYP